jgi:MFS transporter, OFA family, oxalate/formate antiporter
MFYGWYIVALMFLAGFFGGATVWSGFTAYFDPLIREFGWSYTSISVAASLRGAEFGLIAIAIGFLLDRMSVRLIVLIGTLLMGLGFLAMSRMGSLSAFYLSFIVVAIGTTSIDTIVSQSLISRWFHRRLGMVLGIVASGIGAGGFAVPLTVTLLDNIGIRNTFVAFGITAIVLGALTAYFIRSRPEDIGTVSDGIRAVAESFKPENNNQPPSDDLTFRQAVVTPAFWIVTYTAMAMTFSLQMVNTHVLPYLQNIGYQRPTAAVMATLVAGGSISGRLAIGFISDFISRKLLFIIMAVGQVIGQLLFINAGTIYFLVPAALIIGITGGGTNVLRVGTLRDYFGRRYIGSLFGLCLGIAAIGSVSGPILAGRIFDTTKSYTPAWIIAAIVFAADIPLLFLMKNPRTLTAPPIFNVVPSKDNN